MVCPLRIVFVVLSVVLACLAVVGLLGDDTDELFYDTQQETDTKKRKSWRGVCLDFATGRFLLRVWRRWRGEQADTPELSTRRCPFARFSKCGMPSDELHKHLVKEELRKATAISPSPELIAKQRKVD
ncbi:MAG: hypothetical protein MHM6MM_002890 [Cercozoa sp. M6MM]